MVKLLALSMAFISVIFACLLAVIETKTEVILYVLVSLLSNLLLYFVVRNGFLKLGFYSLIYFTSINVIVGNAVLGWRSGLYILLFLMIPVIFYNPLLKKMEKAVLCFFFGLLIASAIILGFMVSPSVNLNTLQLQTMNSFNVIMTCLILAGISYLDFRNTNEVENKLLNLNSQLTYLASRDSLTNLLNRRTMSEMIELEYVRSSRSGKPFGLIMADVDDFKHVNDDYGHAAGDLVLTELSGLISATLRKQDLVSRWGGEEFLILLPETDLEGVQVAAEKVRGIISRSSIVYQGKPINVTVCIGGVVCQDQEDWDECIKHADRALYYGKTHGKNMAIFSKGNTYCILSDQTEEFHSAT